MNWESIELPDGRRAVYTTNEESGALTNGTRIFKTLSEEGDGHPDGSLGTVIGSIAKDGLLAYFVQWDNEPGAGLPVGVAAHRIKEATP